MPDSVKFVNTTATKLSSLPISNGQIIALSDADGFFYDMNNVRHPVGGVRELTSLPEVGQYDVIYVVRNGSQVKSYIWSNSEFIDITGIQYKEVTASDYSKLSEAEKMNGTFYLITDENPDVSINDTVASFESTYSSAKIEALIAERIANTEFRICKASEYSTIVKEPGVIYIPYDDGSLE